MSNDLRVAWRRMDSEAIDLNRVVREIEEEVRRKRATGELPAALEQQLDLDFARYAPPGAAGTDLEHVLARVEQRSHIDVNPPLTSSKPGFAHAKRGLRKLMRWYVRAIAEQTSAFASSMTRAMLLLTERVRRIERAVGFDDVLRLVEEEYSQSFRPSNDSIDAVVTALGSAGGRVLHATAGDGWLLAVLRQHGIDAYGVEPVLSLADKASAQSLDVRPDDVFAHLNSLENESLAAIVLSGCTDYLTVGERQHLLATAVQKLKIDGIITIIGAHPEAWADESLHIVCDLAPGQPFVPATWVAMARQQRLTIERQVDSAPQSYVVVARNRVES
jgi:hypothetical protein